jgi:hypothetical protein
VPENTNAWFMPQTEEELEVLPPVNWAPNPRMKTVFNLEYDWAHAYCNISKSDTCPILVNDDDSFYTDKKEVESMLKKIYMNLSSYPIFKAQLYRVYPNIREFLNARVPIIMDKYNAVTSYINQNRSGSAKLIVFAGMLAAKDFTNMSDKLKDIVSDDKINLVKVQMTENIKNDIAKLVNINDLNGLTSTLDIFDNLYKKLKSNMDDLNGIVNLIRRYKEFFQQISLHYEEGWVAEYENTNFKFIMHMYPMVYKIFSEKMGEYNALEAHRKTNDYIANFLFWKILQDIIFQVNDLLLNSRSTIPKKFTEQLQQKFIGLTKSLQGEINTEFLHTIDTEYNLYQRNEGSEGLLDLAGEEELAARQLLALK